MENRNKILSILITVLLMAGLAAGTYVLFFHKTSDTDQPQVGGEIKLTKVSDDVVVSPFVIADNSAVWYFNSKGQLFRRVLDGSKLEEYSLPSLIPNFVKAIWPASGKDIILLSSDQKNYFSSTTKGYKLLPANVKSLDWMPDNQRIVYIWQSNDNKSQQLILANADVSGFRVIKNVFWPDLVVKVSPDGKDVLLIRSQIQDVNKIYMANLETGEFSTVIDSGKNLEAEWVSPTKFIFTQMIDGKNAVKLYDMGNKQITDLQVSTNLDKAATDSSGLNLYLDTKDENNNDAVWKINIETLEKQKVYQFDSAIQPRGIMVNGQMIFFINSTDSKLYTITQ